MLVVKTAVVPIGGYGTRHLPASKQVPKELFPLGLKPVIHWTVEYLHKAGVTTIYFPSRGEKRIISDYFKKDLALEKHLAKSGKEVYLKSLYEIIDNVKFVFIPETKSFGSATPLYYINKYISKEPFYYIYADDFFYTSILQKNEYQQLLESYNQYKTPIVSSLKLPNALDCYKYGMIQSKNRILHKLVEKPQPIDSPSNYASVSSFLFTPDILNYLPNSSKILSIQKEVSVPDVLNQYIILGQGTLHHVPIKGEYLDTGTPEGYLKAQNFIATNTTSFII